MALDSPLLAMVIFEYFERLQLVLSKAPPEL